MADRLVDAALMNIEKLENAPVENISMWTLSSNLKMLSYMQSAALKKRRLVRNTHGLNEFTDRLLKLACNLPYVDMPLDAGDAHSRHVIA